MGADREVLGGDKGVRLGKDPRNWESNLGHHEHTGAMCRRTNHKAMGGNVILY